MKATPEAQRLYNALFPYYAELCVVTQSHKKGATPGGWGGHAAMLMNGAEMPVEEFIVRHSIGTDFALNFARTAYSARLPMSRESMGEVISYLNGVNESAQKSGYTWNAFTNNCSHVLHNALAAAGVWDPK